MSVFLIHRMGYTSSEKPISRETLVSLLSELDEDPEDEEHFSVSVQHESGWNLCAQPGGYIMLRKLVDEEDEDDESAEFRHMDNTPYDKIIDLLTKVANGVIPSILDEPWNKG